MHFADREVFRRVAAETVLLEECDTPLRLHLELLEPTLERVSALQRVAIPQLSNLSARRIALMSVS